MYKGFLTKCSSSVKNIYFSFTGISMLYLVFGCDVWHSIADVIAVYLLFTIVGPTSVTLTLTWIITMSHLMYGYADAILSNRIHTISWTLPHCVLVLKLIGLGFDLVDGRKNKIVHVDSSQNLAGAAAEIPSFLDYLGFCYFFGSVLAGPQIPFERYQDFITGKLFDLSKTHGSTIAGLRRMSIGLLIAAVYWVLNPHFPLNYLYSEQYKDHYFWERIVLQVAIINVTMLKYIIVWVLVEGSCMITGISYNGSQDGTTVDADWSGVNNVNLLDFYLATGLQEEFKSFNVSTNLWVKRYVYKRLKWLGNPSISLFLSMLFLCLWHGFWFGYLFSYCSEFLYLIVERQVVIVMQKRFGFVLNWKASWFSYIPVMASVLILKNVFVTYLIVPFLLLSWENCFKFLSSVYYFGHILALLWLTAFYLFLKPQKNKTFMR